MWGFSTKDSNIMSKMNNLLKNPQSPFKIHEPLLPNLHGFWTFYCKNYIIPEEIRKYTENEFFEMIINDLIKIYEFVKQNF
jgi:hypothetical protein